MSGMMGKELGPALATAGGAAMLASGNPAGAPLLGTGISGMASGMMPDQKPPPGPMGGGMGQPRPGAAPPPPPAPIHAAGAPQGPGPLAPGGMPGGAQGIAMDPALRKMLMGV